MKTIKTLTLEDAKKALNSMEKKAKELSIDLCFCIVDCTNNIIILEKMDDCKIHSINLARAKAMTAVSLRDSTGNAGKLVREMNLDILYWAGACETGFKGGIPVYYGKNETAPIGAIGVSGGTQEQDEEIAIIGINAMGFLTK
ncbi:MAG: GlcG/HbpS family heme-binding protein [Candidatus Humimicrobiaceae bacterium]